MFIEFSLSVSLGGFSFTKIDFRYTALGLLIPIVFQSINLLVQLQRSAYAFKAGTDLKKVIPIILVNVAVLILFDRVARLYPELSD